MSYAGLGSAEGSSIVTAGMMTAKQASLSLAMQVGVPAEIFDTFDQLTHGATQSFSAKDVAKDVSSLLMSKGISLAHQVATQAGGTRALDDATHLPAGTTDVVLGLASGNVPDLGVVSSVIGAAAGMAICGPLCGVVGGMVGTFVAQGVGELVTGIGELFGSNTKKRQEYEKNLAIAAEVTEIQQALYLYTTGIVQSIFYGVARIYNENLKLGVQDFSPAQILHDAMAGGDRYDYAKSHDGLQPEQVELQARQSLFVNQVFHAVNTVSSGLWDRNAAECGWKEHVEAFLFQGSDPNLALKHASGEGVWCNFSVTDGRSDGHCPCFHPPPGVSNAAFSVQDQKLVNWRCENENSDARYRGWLRNAADWYGKEWGSVASRDCAILMLKGSLDKAKAAKDADTAQAAAVAARDNAAAAYMASVGAQKAQTTGAQQYIDAVVALRAQQARDLAVQQAQQAYQVQTAQLQQSKALETQMLQAQVTSRQAILAIQGKWTTKTKVLAASGVGLLLSTVGAALFWTRRRKRLAA